MAPSIYPSLRYFQRPASEAPLTPALTKNNPEEIKVEPLACKYVEKAAESAALAFADDPIAKYISKTPDAKPAPPESEKKGRKGVWWTIVVEYKETGLALTVNNGEAVVLALPARPDRKRPGVGTSILTGILGFVRKLAFFFASPEQKRRIRETEWKVGFLIRKTLGPQVEELVHVSTLATTPEKQGQGYGTALMKEIIKYADDHGRGIFLETDTEYNVAFYESLGFKVIGETKLGEHNPTWHEKPVTVSLMLREYKKDSVEKVQLLV